MLDLDAQSVRKHWLAIAPGLGPVFDQIDRVEDWTVDDVPQIAERVIDFGRRLSEPNAARRLEGVDSVQLLFVLVHMSTERALLIIQWLDDNHEGLGTRVVQGLLQDDGHNIHSTVTYQPLAQALVSRLKLIQNTPFFLTAFAPERMRKISWSIKQYTQEKGNA